MENTIDEIDETAVAHCDHCLRDECDAESMHEVQTHDSRYRLITEQWCGDCRANDAFECNDCNKVCSNRVNGGDNSDGERICNPCSANYFSCDDCGSRYHNDDYGGDGRCRDCDSNSNCDGMRDDDAKPCLKPRGKGVHFLGVELEVEVLDDDGGMLEEVAQVTAQLGEHAICKGDGSLGYGFEICTSPATLDFHRDILWRDFFAHRHPGLACRDTCGLHVHCSRAPLSELTIAKVVCFVNAARNADFITTIAGRESNSYCKIKTKSIKSAAKRNGDRYEAVNLNPDKTIEFRIFRATTIGAKFFKALEFCDALIKFCAPAGRSVRDCTSRAKFCAFVKEHKRTWPHLHAFIEAAWYCRDNKAAAEYGFAKRGAIGRLTARAQRTLTSVRQAMRE